MSNQVISTQQFVNVFNANIDGISQLAVNARELHSFLNVGRDFSNWIKGRINQYVFVENQDYIVTLAKTGERKNVVMTEYHLTLNTAKELAMVENNEQGRKVRRYFIECEKALLAPTILTADQAFQIKKAVEQKCKSNSVHYQTVWTALRNHFGKATYREIESKDFDEAMLFVESLELPQLALPQPTEQPFFLSKNMAREFTARLTNIFDLVDLLDESKITRKIKQRAISLEQFLIQYEKNEHPKGVDLA